MIYPSDSLYTYGKDYSDLGFNTITNKGGKKSWIFYSYEWPITPNNAYAYQVITVSSESSFCEFTYDALNARSVVYLKPNIEFKKGDYDGSKDKPYELAEVK